jgi:hypothetical protein
MADFWTNRPVATPELADYSIPLEITISNTTISERGFSALNDAKHALAVALDRLDKLVIISINVQLIESEGRHTTAERR